MKNIIIETEIDSIIRLMMTFEIELIIRLIGAAICGGILGIEREHRQKSAGIRTHVIVAIASAIMMIVSKYGFFDVIDHDSVSLDPSRVVSGVVSAIGFLGAGIIFVRKSSAVGLTTAAGIWATVAIGIAMGAGMYFLAVISTGLILCVHTLLHIKALPFNKVAEGYIKIRLENQPDIDRIRKELSGKGISFKSFSLEKDNAGNLFFSASIALDLKNHRQDISRLLEEGQYEEFRLL